MDEELIQLARSMDKQRNEPEEQTRDINVLAASSRLNIAKPHIPPNQEKEIEKQNGVNYEAMVGKSFIRKNPGIYVGAIYEVRSLAGDKFLVARNDPAHGIFEFTMKCDLFHSLMEPPKAQPVTKPNPPPPPKKQSSPWADKK